MPLDVEAELLNRLLVGAIMHLLENHQPHHGIELLGGPTIPVMIMSTKRLDGKFREDLVLKKTCPRAVQELASFGPQVGPCIEQVLLFVVFHVKQCITSYLFEIT